MKQYIILAAILFLFTAKLNAQADEKIYFNNGRWETGIILELIPDSIITFKKESGEIKKYRMRDIRKIIKRYHETLYAEIPNQTIEGTFSIKGGLSVTKYEGAYYSILFDPSFNFFTTRNFSFGVNFSIENFSKGFSLDYATYKAGFSCHYFLSGKPNKPFIGIEILAITKDDALLEGSILAGYNYAISKNLAVQPSIKLGYLDPDHGGLRHMHLVMGIGIANYIF